MPAHDHDLADTRLLIDAVRDGGAIACKFFKGEYKHWSKGKAGPVTEADLAVDAYLNTKLTNARTEYGWLSEESIDDKSRLTKQRLFIADPIDGTRAFIRGLPEFTIVACVVDGTRPVSAAIYNPVTDEMFDATLNGGAHLNGKPIHVSVRTDLEGCRMLSSANMLERPEWTAKLPAMQIEQKRSIAYRMALVAAGQYDAMASLGPKHDWDVAAGDLIVHEAGGLATTDAGATLVYNQPPALQPSTIAAGPRVHACLLERLRPAPVPG